MIVFILGGARSGKSGFAQESAARLSAASATVAMLVHLRMP